LYKWVSPSTDNKNSVKAVNVDSLANGDTK